LQVSLPDITTGVYTWVSGDKLVNTFWAIANAPDLGPVNALNGLVEINQLKNGSYEVAQFLLNQAKASLSYTASAIHDWVSGDKLVNTFSAIATGAARGPVDALNGLVWAKLLQNSGNEVAKFLLNQAQASLAYTAGAIYSWVDDPKGYNTFWSIATGAARGPVDALNGLVGAKLLQNSGNEVAKFLLNQAQASLSYTANAIYNWVNGDKLSNTFWSIANGAGRGPVDALDALVWANLLKNDSYEVAKFLLNQAKASLTYTANAIYNWVGGNNKRVSTFWAIAQGAGQGYANGVLALVWAGYLDNNYNQRDE
jgi:NAD(P)H-hydrate repair Nnr-like enzyme with NAD(P)H-hydrate epimerase domain